MSEMHHEQKAPIRAWLGYYIDGALIGAWKGFPATREDLVANLGGVGVPPDKVTDIVDAIYETEISDLDRRLPRTPDLDELNHLAAKIESMDEYEREMFGAVMEANLHCDSLTSIINVAENLDCFDLYPGDFSEQDIGAILLGMQQEEFGCILDKLKASPDESERTFAAYVERLEKSVNVERYGVLAREDDGGVLTDSGYLRQGTDSIPQTYTGPRDIPAEHQLTVQAEEPERNVNEHERQFMYSSTRLRSRPSLLAALKAAKAQCKPAQATRPDTPEKKLPSGPEL